MAAAIPASLRTADISRFALRASQLEKVKPVIAYWCNFHIVNQILAKGLHEADEESKTFTTNLVERLERVKAANVDEDAITDDTAAQAYVEGFGLDTFERAENAIKASRATRQTADTYQAAATFLELLNTWGDVEPDIAAKIKYAKFHALRIAKAVKTGEDPNLSNPTPEPDPTQEQPALDPNDPEVQILGTPPPQGSSSRQAKPRQPSIEEIADENDLNQRNLAARSTLDASLHPSRSNSVPRQPDLPPPINSNQYADGDVSPLEPSPVTQHPPGQSMGYFPEVPTFTSESKAGDTAPVSPPEPAPPSVPSFPGPAPDLSPLNQPPPNVPTQPPPTNPQQPTPHDFYRQQPQQPRPQPPPQPALAPVQPAVSRQPAQMPQAAPGTENYEASEEAVAKAQKHARWAISALNFEDVATAVRELRGALDSLGAR